MRGNFITDRKGDKNPNYKHGLKHTRIFSIWVNMRTRCYNPNTTHYHRYGGRGITICDEWRNDIEAFYNWATSNGYSDDLTLDRINVNGNYEPSNCRWVDIKTQARNKSKNRIFTINGLSKSLIEWCEIYKINYRTVQDRLKRNWTIEKALSEPVKTQFRRKDYVTKCN